MSVSLSLFPNDRRDFDQVWGNSELPFFPTTSLRVYYAESWRDQIGPPSGTARPVPNNMTVFDPTEDDPEHEATITPMGDPLTFLTAEELLNAINWEETERHPYDRGIKAYLAAIPPDTPILLWWH